MALEHFEIELTTQRIKKLIERSGKTLRELEEETGISNGTWAMWKNGKKMPRADSLFELAKYFNVSADWLIGISDKPVADVLTKEHEKIIAAEVLRLSDKAIDRLTEEPPKFDFNRTVSPEEAERLVQSGEVKFRAWKDSEMKLLSRMIEDNSLLKIINKIDQYSISIALDTAKRKRYAQTGKREDGMIIGTLPGGEEKIISTVFSDEAELRQYQATKAVTIYTEQLQQEIIAKAGGTNGTDNKKNQ